MTVVLLHAFPLDERMWEPQLAVLERYDVFAPRLYGRGASIEDWASSVLGDVDGEVTAVGASMGGYVALAMARAAPERVRGLLLAGSRAGADTPERKAFRNELIEKLRVEGPPDNAGPGVTVDELIEATRVLRDRPDATEVVRSFGSPFLLAVGDRDELLSVEEAREIVALAPRGRLEVFPGAGHFLTLEQPGRFNAVLLEFLEEVEQSGLTT